MNDWKETIERINDSMQNEGRWIAEILSLQSRVMYLEAKLEECQEEHESRN